VVDGVLGTLYGKLELFCEFGSIGVALFTSFIVKPDKPLQIKLIPHDPSKHNNIFIKSKAV
jgi:hypothetical protein